MTRSISLCKKGHLSIKILSFLVYQILHTRFGERKESKITRIHKKICLQYIINYEAEEQGTIQKKRWWFIPPNKNMILEQFLLLGLIASDKRTSEAELSRMNDNNLAIDQPLLPCCWLLVALVFSPVVILFQISPIPHHFGPLP